MQEMIDRKLVLITVYLNAGQLMRRLEIPGRGTIVGPAEPDNLCEEGRELFEDLTREHRDKPDGIVVFQGTQFGWEEVIVNGLLASRGQRINWQR